MWAAWKDQSKTLHCWTLYLPVPWHWKAPIGKLSLSIISYCIETTGKCRVSLNFISPLVHLPVVGSLRTIVPSSLSSSNRLSRSWNCLLSWWWRSKLETAQQCITTKKKLQLIQEKNTVNPRMEVMMFPSVKWPSRLRKELTQGAKQ